MQPFNQNLRRVANHNLITSWCRYLKRVIQRSENKQTKIKNMILTFDLDRKIIWNQSSQIKLPEVSITNGS